MFTPICTPVGVVKQERLEVVHYLGKACFGGFSCFKFFKECAKLITLILGKYSKYSISRFFLTLFLCFQSLSIVCVGITRIDFYNIVNERHHHRFGDVKAFVGILLQQINHHCHVPCVFGIIFSSAVSAQVRLSQDVLFLVGLKYKTQLFFKTFFIHPSITLYYRSDVIFAIKCGLNFIKYPLACSTYGMVMIATCYMHKLHGFSRANTFYKLIYLGTR